MQVTQFDVVIVGGGLAGLSLACALSGTRLRVALVEQRVPIRPAGWDVRVYAISPVNARFLQRTGAWKHLPEERIASLMAMEVYGDTGARLDFSAYASGLSELGWVIESSLIACELWENVKRQNNLTLFSPAAPSRVEIRAEEAILTLTDGRTVSTKLLVGADGRDSWLRQTVGLSAETTSYGELGVVANFACERQHRGIARQWFRTDGVLAWLPLAGERLSIVWSTAEEHARTLLALAGDELSARVASAGQHALGDLKLLTPAAAFPLSLMRVPRTFTARLALIGDAAHGIHPLSGHGINLGFQDARVLGELLAAAPAWQDPGSERLLARYQRERREEIVLMQSVTHALQRLFASDFAAARRLRNVGMNLTNGLPVIKNLLVRYAIGAF